jgi:hypothetical protein
VRGAVDHHRSAYHRPISSEQCRHQFLRTWPAASGRPNNSVQRRLDRQQEEFGDGRNVDGLDGSSVSLRREASVKARSRRSACVIVAREKDIGSLSDPLPGDGKPSPGLSRRRETGKRWW